MAEFSPAHSLGRSAAGRLHLAVVAVFVIICGLLIGFDAWRTWQARSVQISVDQMETANLARSLAQHAHDTLQAADTALVGLRQTVEADGLAEERLPRLRAFMAASLATLPIVHGLFVYDATGHWIVNSTPDAPRTITNVDRAYFQYHRANPDRDIHVGVPVHAKTDGKWVVTLSRRVNAPDGSFAGLVLATISIDSLQEFYQSFDVGQHGIIGLASSDGLIVARQPIDDSLIGTSVASGHIFREMLPVSPVGNFEAPSVVDGVMRVGTYRRIDGFPFVILVSRSLEEALAGWRSDAWYHAEVSVGAAAIIALLGSRFARQIRQTQQAERRYRVLAEHSNDAIMCVGLDGRRRYVSPAFASLTGWNIDDNPAQEWAYFVHPDDRKAIRAIGTRLTDGVGQAMATYRYLCKDGSHLWVEASFVLLPAEDGEPAQFVVNIRDVTARKFAEERLAAASQKSATRAAGDTLQGRQPAHKTGSRDDTMAFS